MDSRPRHFASLEVGFAAPPSASACCRHSRRGACCTHSIIFRRCPAAAISGRSCAAPSRSRQRRQPTGCSSHQLLAAIRRQEDKESEQVGRLRQYASFLTPEPGLASLDTWAGVVLWVRNTLINWMVFLPLLLAGAAAAISYAGLDSLVAALVRVENPENWGWILVGTFGVLGLACLGFEVYSTCILLPSHMHPDAPDTPNGIRQRDRPGATPPEIRRRILRPIWAWVYLAPLAAAPWVQPGSAQPTRDAMFTSAARTGPLPPAGPHWSWFLLPIGALLVSLLAFGAAWLQLRDPRKFDAGPDKTIRDRNRKLHGDAFRKNAPRVVIQRDPGQRIPGFGAVAGAG